MARSTSFKISSLGCLLMACGLVSASAQQFPQYGGRDQVCQRLEGQLASIDRSGGDPGRADQVRRFEEMAGRQQAELDRATMQSRRLGCDASGFFQLFGGGGRSDQCGPLNNQIQQLRSNLARTQGDLQRLQGAGGGYERDNQRRAVLTALAQNDCGPQYRSAAANAGPRNFFEQLFGGPGSIVAPEPDPNMPGGGGSGYRTVCVRTCDGYFFPISFSTSPDRFQDDEATCQRMCPAAEVVLYSHRNPGEDMRQAVSTGGRLYTEMPNAFKYKTEWNAACSCKQAGESWANAVKDDPNAPPRGDIIVTEERARQMSAPRDAKGRLMLLPGQKGPAAADAASAPAAAETPTPESSGEKKPIRTVGPKFLQTQ
ncbi:DUF2865 domain-containing protein [Pseudorhodoplanes sinuspersici]|nr:DUF2865 domain-containing protein [Pseudorhodoplanes sinuspersici]